MIAAKTNPTPERERLRNQYYNATITKVVHAHEDLMILSVRPDAGVPCFVAGQFTILGLGVWEQQLTDVADESPDIEPTTSLIRRAYSISCTMLDECGRLVRACDTPYLEFYISRIRRLDSRRPSLTPRLFALSEGSRLFCDSEVYGHYCLPNSLSLGNVVFVATGTGEAPHNAMVAELLVNRFPGQIISITCARMKNDLAYWETHRELARRFRNYRYLGLTTREPENIDPLSIGFVGKRHVQDYFQSGDFERDSQARLNPANTHVFLCGNPEMIGHTQASSGQESTSAQAIGMIQILEQRGFWLDHPHAAGNIHVEKYWMNTDPHSPH